jgi:hypothetical protein
MIEVRVFARFRQKRWKSMLSQKSKQLWSLHLPLDASGRRGDKAALVNPNGAKERLRPTRNFINTLARRKTPLVVSKAKVPEDMLRQGSISMI